MEKFLGVLQVEVALPLILPLTFIVLVCVAMVRSVSKQKQQKSAHEKASSRFSYHYRAKKHIMTKREETFFLTLCDIFKDKCYVIPQVHLSALLEHRITGQNWKGAFSHINGKSVDYVLLRRKDLSVLCAVELDDSTHDSPKRIERDKEVGLMLGTADIPLVRLRTPEKMSKQDIVDSFAQVINKANG